MKAFTIAEPEVLCCVEIPEPTTSPADVLLKVRRIGYCGSDLNTFRGGNPVVSYPRIPGHEIAAEVLSIGSDVPAGFAVGETVTVFPYTQCGECSACLVGRPNCCKFNQTLGVQRDGALTETIAVPWRNVIQAPGLSVVELALVEPLSVGFHAAERGRVTADDTVCVIGCGMIGLGAIAGAALNAGARVIAVDVADNKLVLATKAGASHTVNSANEDLHTRLMELTGGHGPDVMIEAVGMDTTFRACIDEVCFAGRVVYIGYAKRPVSYETKYFVMKEIDILGSRNATRENFQSVIETLRSGRYPVQGTITQSVPFAEAGKAMQRWANDPSRVTKIQIEVDAKA
ncbi:putative zinc-type alcohol dehydrogenase-like protein YjmD [Planctomycetes bacterium CA13]|uniref:Putative zinc-type alcohol dehydrogenase-like protein YjmD n=1 Tax=Novipirellula herctigrandis TaxID=2527986 RepID=A0A5C5Z928_9BACT|nr:putative zinc-type alcohol dehydrogenase-like protein YjmD [Planctomycetes bacterium CA13]